jgi:beta-glucosidase
MLIGLRDRKMTPMVTLHHFSEPLWVAEMGGWENEAIIELFAAFVRKAVEALMPYCQLWVTINEPNVFAFGAYVDGVFPPGKKTGIWRSWCCSIWRLPMLGLIM